MSKKHEMSEQEYRIYKQQHDYEDPIEAEEEKISQEKDGYVQQRRKGKSRLDHQLRRITTPEDLDETGEELDLPDEDHAAARVIRNARTHKRRLVGLRKREEQE